MRYRLHASQVRTRGLLIGVTAMLLAGCGKGATGPEVPALPPGVVAGGPGELSFLWSNPDPGSAVDHRYLSLELSWTPTTASPADLEVTLLDASGRACVALTSFVSSTFPSTGPPYRVSAFAEGDLDGRGFLESIKCPMPFDVTTLAATDRGTPRRRWTLPLRYRFEDPSVSPSPTAPTIVSMRWDTLGIPTGESCPLTDEAATVDCVARDADGDSFTITLSLENVGPGTLSDRYPVTVSQTFPATRALAETTHRIGGQFVVRPPAGTRFAFTHVQATCEAVDSQGRRAVQVGQCSP
jgi:hypothetical protein